jgi:hypothetical protein
MAIKKTSTSTRYIAKRTLGGKTTYFTKGGSWSVDAGKAMRFSEKEATSIRYANFISIARGVLKIEEAA